MNLFKTWKLLLTPNAVADVSIMLALMSSRNDGKSLTLAKDGLVSTCSFGGLCVDAHLT